VLFSMRIIFPTLFCFVLFATPASAQFPVPAARGKTIDVSLGFSYVSRPGGFSDRVRLNGADASFTIGYSRLGLKTDLGYARASNFKGTGRHTDVLTYMVGPVFHPTMHRNFATYIHALGGAARVSGPVPLTGGGFLLGGWATDFAWMVGGGVDYSITDSISMRTGVDYIRTSYFDPSIRLRGQSNFRTTATVVYYFAKPSRARSRR
jgi:opacity protein-like surface antigen